MMKCLRRQIDETCAAWALLLFAFLLRKVLTDLSAAQNRRPISRAKFTFYKFTQMMWPGCRSLVLLLMTPLTTMSPADQAGQLRFSSTGADPESNPNSTVTNDQVNRIRGRSRR